MLDLSIVCLGVDVIQSQSVVVSIMRKIRCAYVSPIAEVLKSVVPMRLLGTLSLDGNVGGFERGEDGNINEDVWDDYVDNP